jgi:hypothetical protein
MGEKITVGSEIYANTELYYLGRIHVVHEVTTRNLNFMGPCIVIFILIYIQRDAILHSLFYLETTLHVSGATSTHPQGRKQLCLQHLLLVAP